MLTDDAIMARVWSSHDLPVRLTRPDPNYPWAPPIPFPRERIAVTVDTHGAWHHRCACNDPRGLGDLERPATPRPSRAVAMVGFRVFVDGPEHAKPRTATVYLGQCEDCGRIYWGIVR